MNAAPGYGPPAPGYGPPAYGVPGAGQVPGGLPGVPAYKEPTVAWLLWFFLGTFGGHHFYLGNTQRGVLYLVGAIVSFLLTVVLIGFLGLLALFVLWIVDAVRMTSRIQQANARIHAQRAAVGWA